MALAELARQFERLEHKNNLVEAADPVDTIQHMAPQDLREFTSSLYAMVQLCLDQDAEDTGEGASMRDRTLIPSLAVGLGFPQLSIDGDFDEESLDSHESDDQGEEGGKAFRMSRSASSRISVDGYEYINDFMIIDQIGRGQFGKVVLAVQDGQNDPVAIKIVPRKVLVTKKAPGSPKAASVALHREFEAPRLIPLDTPSVPGPEPAPKTEPISLAILTPPPTAMATSAVVPPLAIVENDLDIETLQREVAIMKKLRHRNIVQLHECIDDAENGSMYLVMQYVNKGPIFTLDDDGCCATMEHPKIRHYLRQIVSGLSYLERNGVLHMDIKPDNILVNSDDVVFLADFGMSEVIERSPQGAGNTGRLDSAARSESSMSTSRRSATPRPNQPTQRGTPAFMSPEMCQGFENITAATDVWSLGVTLYCMLVGHLPFRGRSWREVTRKIIEEDPYIPPDLDPQWADLLLGMLNKDPDERSTLAALRRHPLIHPSGRLSVFDGSSSSLSISRELSLTPRDASLEISNADMEGAITVARRHKKLSEKSQRVQGTQQQASLSLSSFTAFPVKRTHLNSSNCTERPPLSPQSQAQFDGLKSPKTPSSAFLSHSWTSSPSRSPANPKLK